MTNSNEQLQLAASARAAALARARLVGDLARATIARPTWRSSADARFALYRLLATVPWAAAATADTPADTPCGLSTALGRIFDETSVPRYELRALARTWTRWAAGHIRDITGAWADTIGAGSARRRRGSGSSGDGDGSSTGASPGQDLAVVGGPLSPASTLAPSAATPSSPLPSPPPPASHSP